MDIKANLKSQSKPPVEAISNRGEGTDGGKKSKTIQFLYKNLKHQRINSDHILLFAI